MVKHLVPILHPCMRETLACYRSLPVDKGMDKHGVSRLGLELLAEEGSVELHHQVRCGLHAVTISVVAFGNERLESTHDGI